MAKLGLRKTSRRVDKKTDKKKVEKLVQTLHKEERKSLLIRLPHSLHKELKLKSVTDDISINEFVTNLIEDALLNDRNPK